MCRGLVDMCLNIQSEDKDSSGQCWLTDDMIKALILDVIGAGNQRWKQGAGVLSAENTWFNILSFSIKTYVFEDKMTKYKSVWLIISFTEGS